ncbi:MAG: low molecular weight protein-tyrosine-phosphatase [Bacteroidota bacterium]|nr:low molecular weight protein-tyrosine-phosphatase [Bacteroidota bacterium]
MYKVLFVCLGNICRSPLAAAVFANKLKEKNSDLVFEIDSAGTHNYHAGKPADERVLLMLNDRNIEINHLARRIELKDFDYFDYIFAMDENNYEAIHKLAPNKNYKAKIVQFRKYDPYSQGSLTVPDPYYGDMKDFQVVYNIIDDTLENLYDRFSQGLEVN